jgi:hypothetical protein
MLDQEGLNAFYQKLFKEIELDYLLMPAGVRRRCTDSEHFGLTITTEPPKRKMAKWSKQK